MSRQISFEHLCLPSLTTFNIQNYYVGRQTEAGQDANQFWLRYAQPFFTAYLIDTGNPAVSFGFGPVLMSFR